MNSEIDELKELVRQNIALSQQTYKAVHKMRRSQMWGRVFAIVWWLLILAVSGYTYYVYAQPYVDKITQIYMQVGASTKQAQNLSSEVSGFFGNWMLQHQATTSTTSVQ